MASRYNITSTVQRVVAGVLQPGSSASALITDPLGSTITVYAAETGASTVTNPIATTSFGRIDGWVATPDYNITVSGSGITTYTEYIRQSPQGTVSVEGSTTINWGTGYGVSDTNLYRGAANVLKTDDNLQSVSDINARVDAATRTVIGEAVSGKAGIAFGSALDTNLYRDAASELKTDDNFYAVLGMRSGNGAEGAYFSSQTSGNVLLKNKLLVGDANPSFQITGLGIHSWGAGGASAVDTTLYRLSAGIIKTDGAFQAATTLTGATINATTGFQVNGSALASTHLTDTAALARLAGPTFTGVPAAPTAAVNTNTTQLASTAFVVGQAGTATPIVEGTGTAGTSLRYSREDHVHPSTESNPSFSGTVTAQNLTVTGNTLLGDAGTDTIGVFGVAGVVRASTTADIKDALTSYGWLQGTSATPLNLDGGALTAGAISGTTANFSSTLTATTITGTAISGTTGIFSNTLTASASLDHDGTTVGFYGRTPTVINATPFTNGAGLGTSQADLPAGFTINQLGALVMTLLKQLGDVNGVGLINTTSI